MDLVNHNIRSLNNSIAQQPVPAVNSCLQGLCFTASNLSPVRTGILIQERAELERKLKQYSPYSKIGESLKPEIKRQLFANVIDLCLKENPGFLSVFESVGINFNSSVRIKNMDFPCPVNVLPERINHSLYIPLLNRCVINRKLPDEADLLVSLCENGSIGPFFSSLAHEMTHLFQMHSGARLAASMVRNILLSVPVAATAAFGPVNGLALAAFGAGSVGLMLLKSIWSNNFDNYLQIVANEVHAYYTERSNPAGEYVSYMPGEIKEYVVNKVTAESYLNYEDFAQGNSIAERLYEIIDTLTLMGRSAKEIALLAGQARYCYRTQNFPDLETEFIKEMQKFNTEEEFFSEINERRIELHMLKMTQKLKAKEIALRALNDFTLGNCNC